VDIVPSSSILPREEVRTSKGISGSHDSLSRSNVLPDENVRTERFLMSSSMRWDRAASVVYKVFPE
jgi:hypothetical protein